MTKRILSLKRTGTAIVTLLLMLAFAATAQAADSSVTYNGTYAGSLFGFAPDSGSGKGLFPDFQSMMPGGTYTQKVKISNVSSQRIELFLRGEPASDVAGLLNKVTIEVEDESGNIVVQESKPTASWPTSGLITNAGRFVHLGRFYRGDAETLTVTLKVPADLGNEFQNAIGKVNWVFQADVYEYPDDPDDPDDPDIPLGPPVVTINENPIPLAPGTGDSANPLLWGGLLLVFAILLVILLVQKRRGRV